MADVPIDYRGWSISKWTGWKTGAGDFLVAQWLARKGEGDSERFLYASTPGATGPYRTGDTFDTTRQPGQAIIDADTPEEIRAREQGKTHERLLRCIDAIEQMPSE